MTVQIQLRRGTAAAWTAANPTLSSGELGLETDTGKIKMGDGATAWVSLGYFGGAPSGSAGGDLSGTYPNPSVSDNSHAHDTTTVTTHSTAHAHSALTGIGATDHHSNANDHVRSHDHSVAGDGTALVPATLTIPGATAPAQTAEGSAVWDTDDDKLTIGTGAARKTLMNTDTSVLAAQMPALTGDVTSSAGGVATVLAAGSASNLNSGTLPAGRMPALTGDVTTSAGAVATAIGAGKVTLAMLANLAANSIMGNNTGAGATPIALTAAQVKTLLAIAQADVAGLGVGDSPTHVALTLTNGQIVFPSTAVASANANTLDDYEEGAFTPGLSYVTPGTSSWASVTALGWYTKVGNRVFVEIYYTAVPTNGTASGNIQLTGLPFTSVNTANKTSVGACSFTGYTKAGYTNIFARLDGAASSTIIFQGAGTGVAFANLAVADIPSAGTVILRISGSYAVT